MCAIVKGVHAALLKRHFGDFPIKILRFCVAAELQQGRTLTEGEGVLFFFFSPCARDGWYTAGTRHSTAKDGAQDAWNRRAARVEQVVTAVTHLPEIEDVFDLSLGAFYDLALLVLDAMHMLADERHGHVPVGYQPVYTGNEEKTGVDLAGVTKGKAELRK